MKACCIRMWVGVLLAVMSVVRMAGAQGDLAPSGPPGPGMKTLQQVEPRIPIEGLPVAITQPGSYYLMGNLTLPGGMDGITIDADDVVLDLNGYALNGAGAGASGIVMTNNHSNVAIRNGIVRNWGVGIDLGMSYNAMFSELQCFNNSFDGLAAGPFSEVRNVLSSGNGGMGIFLAQGCRVHACTAHDNSIGIYASGTGNEIVDCTAQKSGTIGIYAGVDGAVRRCLVRNNTGPGIVADAQSIIENNQCLWQTNAAGIVVSGPGSRIVNNVSQQNMIGLEVLDGYNTIADNMVSGNVTNYELHARNQISLVLGELPETIAWPAKVTLAGSLYLSNVAAGITIASDNVTIDLGGHALVGGSSTLDGITVAGNYKNITVRNGTVEQWGQSGVNLSGGRSIRVENITATTNGQYGIWTGRNSVLRDCVACFNGDTGISAGYASAITDCASEGNGGVGIIGAQGSVIQQCVASGNTGIGLYTDSGVIRGSSSWQNGADGISVSVGGIAADCSATMNGGNGISATLGGNVIRDCSVSGNGGDGVYSDYASMIHHSVISVNASNGITMSFAGSVHECFIRNNSGCGIVSEYDGLISDCEVYGNIVDGIVLGRGGQVRDSVIAGHYNMYQRGIRAEGDYNSFKDNRISGNWIGLEATGTYNYVVRNYAQNNTTNYNISFSGGANDVGAITADPGYNFSSDQPWMNVE
ncbi:MAG: right-handed parallel beta-helix repeat-containing protein [Spartobacteria bacterium]|nr:right-handed parallel beta-helix repeat-containing protein [Spartobacteria bacterium]